MNIKYTNVKIEFKSMKDLGVVHKMHLNDLKTSIRAIGLFDATGLREAELELKELLAEVKNKQEQIWSASRVSLITKRYVEAA